MTDPHSDPPIPPTDPQASQASQQPTALLQPLPEGWSSLLAVVAHPDDLEYGSAAAIARWTSQGKTVRYCLATSGEAGIDAIRPEECGPLREEEQRRSAAVVGVSEVEFLGFEDGVLEYGLPLRRAIAGAIRRHRPDVVLTGNYADSWPGGFPNQADHIAIGRACLDAIRDAGNRWVFTDLPGQPWNGVKALLVAGSPSGRHAVDTTEYLAAGVASLAEHRAYLQGLNKPDFDVEEFLESMARQAGAGFGTKYAAGFEVVPFGEF